MNSELTTISGLESNYSFNAVNRLSALKEGNTDKSFDNVLQSVMNIVNETDTMINSAEEESIKYALGYSDNTHDLQIAQQKANLALQYTVAVRDKFLDAYKEIMNIQI